MKTLIALLIGAFLIGCVKTTPENLIASRDSNATISSVPTTRKPKHISDQARLRKLSFHLRGMTPERSDYEGLKDAQARGASEAFFLNKTKEYLASAQHVGKMIARLEELFRFRIGAFPPEMRFGVTNLSAKGFAGFESYNSAGFLFESVARNNLQWDELLLTKGYLVPSQRLELPGTLVSDLGFYNFIVRGLPTAPDGVLRKSAPAPETPVNVLPISFEKNDPRIAGAITTPRFFNRYTTTILNKSRGRAAAIFRIFLCDDMRAAIEPKAGEDEALLDKVFPPAGSNKPFASHPAVNANDEAKHGTSADCMACHYKLDPLGQTFVTTGSVLHEQAAPGALVFRRKNGELVDVKGRGIGDVAKAISEQPEYLSCQVGHFWKWFIGADKPLSEERTKELARAFDQLERKTNDFVSYIVNQPEFYEELEERSEITLNDVAPLFRRCDSCHQGDPDLIIPPFATFPVESQESHADWLTKIGERLDLANDGAQKTMPPKISGWKLTEEDYQVLKTWIRHLAPDANGKPTIDSSTAEKLLRREKQ